MEYIESGTTRVITGNNAIANIAVNRGTLRIVGNNCRVSVLCNLGSVVYTGNQGWISVGSSTSHTIMENVKGHVSVTGLNVQITVGDTCYPQNLQLVGSGMLHLPGATHVLNGCANIKVKEGRIKKPRNKSPQVSTTVHTSSTRCSLYLSGMNGKAFAPLTRKHFGLK
jgi:hypothetical protein